ncbi:MAG: type pilus biosis/stability protein PilW [Verrucomicrobiaceae bacterium]|nr:type pilus biosis/stability protein PilW [Verrucomicrobiaceae bacterium]
MTRYLSAVMLTFFTLFALQGCVTTQTGGFGEKKDPKKALEYSVQAARGYIQQGNWEAAKRHLKTALEIDDRNADVHETMAQVFWNTGEYEQADLHFRRALSINSNDARIHNNYAAFLYDRKRYAEAETELEKVAEDLMYDRRADAFVNLGRVRIKLKKYAAAKDVLERAALMDRGNLMLTFQLAEVYYQLGDYAKAQSYYDSYRKSVNGQTAASLWLGIRLAEKFSDYDAAASYALALKNLYPQSEEYLAYKGANRDGGTKP